MSRTPIRYAVALAVIAALTLAGCSGTTPAPATPSVGSASATTHSSPSSAPTITATAPTTSPSPSSTSNADIPAAARAQTPEGAYAFARHFIEQVNAAWTKPQAGLLPPLSTTTCKTCGGFEATASRYVASKTHYDRTPLEVIEVSSHGPATPGPTQTVDVVAHQTPAHVVDGNGKSVGDIAEQRGIFVFDVTWIGNQWRINEIQVQK